jgi:N-acetylglucosamine-6-phosphate deacetylase
MRLFGRLYTPFDRGLGVVGVEGGVISAIEAVSEKPKGAIGDATSSIWPGLVDIQVNGAFGHDFSNPECDASLAGKGLPRYGVTAFQPVIITSPQVVYQRALANLKAPAQPGWARVLGVHVEGPYLAPKRVGAHNPQVRRDPRVEEVAQWLEWGDVRLVTLAPELPGAEQVIPYLVRRGVVVSMGHSDATYDEAARGVDLGATLVTHLFNAMRPFGHRDPGIMGYTLANHVTASVIADGVHSDMAALRLAVRAKAPDELVVTTDAISGLGMPVGSYFVADRQFFTDGIVGRLADGTLSGSVLPLNRALKNLVKAGATVEQAVQAATLNPARVLGLEGSMGQLRVGRAADVVVVDREWDVEICLVGGTVGYAREGLAATA